MSRLIDADAITDHEIIDYLGIRYASCLEDVRDLLNEQPIIEAVPVVHGKWVDNGIPESMLSGCSACGFTCGAYSFNFCPNCGADMRKGGAE